MIKTDQTGKKSFYDNSNIYLTDGWVGGVRPKSNAPGEYIEDINEDIRYLFVEKTDVSSQKHLELQAVVDAEGFLHKYRYRVPSSAQINQYQTQGYTVTNSGNIIAVKDSTISLVWDTLQKSFALQIFENFEPIVTKKFYFKYDLQFNEDILYKTIENKPGTFTNGEVLSNTFIKH